MKKKPVLFIHGAGHDGYEADRILAAALQNALGADYDVLLPPMPSPDSPEYEQWRSRIEHELAGLASDLILVGHSLGGSVLLKYLAEERVENRITAVCLIAAPYWGADEDWQYETFALRDDFAAKLPAIPHIYLYHCRDDEIVPFAHVQLYAERLPQATLRAFAKRGHQLLNDLSEVALDIKGAATAASG